MQNKTKEAKHEKYLIVSLMIFSGATLSASYLETDKIKAAHTMLANIARGIYIHPQRKSSILSSCEAILTLAISDSRSNDPQGRTIRDEHFNKRFYNSKVSHDYHLPRKATPANIFGLPTIENIIYPSLLKVVD